MRRQKIALASDLLGAVVKSAGSDVPPLVAGVTVRILRLQGDLAEDDARAILQEMVDLQQRELDLYKREQTELLGFLTPVQLVRFYQLRESLGQRVNQLRQGRGQGNGAGGQPGRPGGSGPGGRTLR